MDWLVDLASAVGWLALTLLRWNVVVIVSYHARIVRTSVSSCRPSDKNKRGRENITLTLERKAVNEIAILCHVNQEKIAYAE